MKTEQTATKMNAIAVDFHHFNGKSFEYVRVPLADVAAYHASTHEYVCRVWFDNSILDGGEFWSFGKSWTFVKDGTLARIGAGAYGDMTVWTPETLNGR